MKIKTKYTNPFQNNLYAIVMMVCHVLALSLLYAAIKALVDEDLSSNIVVFMYKLTILILVIPLCLTKGIKSMQTDRLGLHFIRAFFSICGSLCMFYAIKFISLADISAIQYLEHILLLVIGIFYFGERITKTKTAVIMVSFVGALFVIRPDLVKYLFNDASAITTSETGFNHCYIFVFGAITFWALNSCMVKILGRTEKTNAQVFYTTLFSCILSFPVAFMHWTPVGEFVGLEIRYPTTMLTFAETNLSVDHIISLVFLGILYFIHSITHFKALKHADLSLVVPFEYSRLVFAALLGYIMFDEVPTMVKAIGYAFIIGAGLYLIYSERRRHVRRRDKVKV